MIKHINSKILLLISLFLISVSGSLLAEVPDYCEGLDTTEKVEQASLSLYKKKQCNASIDSSAVLSATDSAGRVVLQNKTTVFSEKETVNNDYCSAYATEEALDAANLSDYKKLTCRKTFSDCYSAFADKEVCEEADLAVYKIIVAPITKIKYATRSQYSVQIEQKNEASTCINYKYNEGFTRNYQTTQKILTNGAFAKNERGCIKTVSRDVSNLTIFENDFSVGPKVGNYTITYYADGVEPEVVIIKIIDNEPPQIALTGNAVLSTPPSNLYYSDSVVITDNYLAQHSEIKVTATFKNASGGIVGSRINFSNASPGVWTTNYKFPDGARKIVYSAVDVSGNIATTAKGIAAAPSLPVFGLHVVAPDNTAIEMVLTPSATISYAYSEPAKRITTTCMTYTWNASTASYALSESQNILDALGAYVKSDYDCIEQAVRAVSNNTVFETDYTKGPLLGDHTIKYSGPSSATATQVIKVVDNIIPTIVLQGNATIQSPPSTSVFNDAITVTDNYLATYSNMVVTAKIKNSANTILSTKILANSSANNWTLTYSIPVNSSKIEYTATDSAGNTSTIVTRAITAPPTVTQHLAWVEDGDQASKPLDIEPHETATYAYIEPSNNLSSICAKDVYDASTGRYIQVQSNLTIATLGAYLARSNGCHEIATRAVSNETIFEKEQSVGPLIGKYTITYSSTTVSNQLVKEINIVDTIAPTVTFENDDPVAPDTAGSFADSVTITDNYLAGYSNITVGISFKDADEVLGDICTECAILNSSDNVWTGEYDIPSGSTFIVYTIKDESGNARVSERKVADTSPSEFLVNTYTRYYQRYPAVASLINGGFVITWQSYYQDRSGWGIYAQQYDIAGNEVGEEFLVNTRTYHHQEKPDIAALPDGGFVITWQSWYQNGYYPNIYAQRYDASGNKSGGSVEVNSYTSYYQSEPSVSASLDGGFIITWQSYYQDRSGYGVYAQRFDAQGSKTGPEFLVNTTNVQSQYNPTITTQSDGSFTITWYSYSSWPLYSYNIFAQRYDISGKTIGDEFRVNTHTQAWRYKIYPSIAALPDGGLVVSWSSYYQDRSGYGIYAQRYDISGKTIGDEFKVNTHTSRDQKYSSTASLPDGGFIITWQSYNQDPGRYDYGVFAQKYHSDGTTNGDEFQVNTYDKNHQYYPDVTSLVDGGIVITWQSAYQDGSYDGIYGQLYPGSGSAGSGSGPRYQLIMLAENASLTPSTTDSYAYTEASEKITSECEVHTVDETTEEVTVTKSTQSIIAIGAYVKSNFGCIDVTTREISNSTIFETNPALGPLIGSHSIGYSSSLVNFPRSVYINVIDNEAPEATFDSDEPAAAGSDGLFTESITITDNYLAGYNNITIDVAFEDAEEELSKVCSDCKLDNDGTNSIWSGDFEIATTAKVIVYTIKDEAGNSVTLEKDVKGLSTDDFLVNTRTSSTQFSPDTAHLKNGGFVITWSSYGQDGSSYGVYAQLYDKWASPVGSEFKVNSFTSGSQEQSKVASLENGGFVITWHSYNQDAGRYDYGVFAQMYNADGSTKGDEFQANTFTSSSQLIPTVAGLKDGGFVITWSSQYQDGSGYGVYAQRYDSNGDRVGVTSSAPTNQLIQIRNYGAITKARASINEYGTDYTNGDTSELIKFDLWIDATELNSFGVGATEIRGYQFDINWNAAEVDALNFPIIAGTNIGFNAANPLNSAITFNSTNGSVAMASSTAIVDTDISNDGPPSFVGTDVLIGTFYMNPNANIETVNLSIDNMMIVTDTANINPANYTTTLEVSSVDGSEFLVNTTTRSYQLYSEVASLANGGFVITWMSYYQDGSAYGIFAQRFDRSGVAIGPEFQVNTFTPVYQWYPRVASFSDGGFIITWTSIYQDGNSYGVYAQRYDANGNRVGGEFLVNTRTYSRQEYPDITVLPDNNFLITWHSYGQDGSGYGIHAQRYDASGTRVGEEFQVNDWYRNHQLRPAITALTDGAYVITWHGYGDIDSSYGVYAKLYYSTDP